MSVTGLLYGKVGNALWNAEIDYISDVIKVSLHTSGYTPDQDAHDYKDDLTNEVAATGGYTAGGQALTSKTMTYTGATNKHVLDAADPQWAASTITCRTASIHDDTPGSDATRPLIGFQQSSVDIATVGGNLDLIIASAGLVETTYA